jgi:hypothetical protein
MQAGVAQEGETEWCLSADAVEASFLYFGNFADGVGARIGELFGLEAAPHVLDRIQVWSVARQSLRTEPLPVA